MPAPACVITGTFESLIGATTGSVKFDLQNYGNNPPKITGTGMIVGTSVATATGASFSVTLYGNDAITPANTYYLVTFFDSNGHIVIEVPYSFTGVGGDLSNLSPLNVLPTTAVGIPVLQNPTQLQTIVTYELDVPALGLTGSSSGKTVLQAVSAASGTITIPATTDTVVCRNTTDTLTNKTLSSPTINTPTLNGSGGLLTLPAGPSTLVGRSTTDNLQNKTLQGQASGNAVTLLNVQGAQAQLTGNSADQVMFTYSLPGNTMQAGKGIRLYVMLTHDVGSAAITYKVNFGAASMSFGGVSGPSVTETAFIFNNSGVTNAQTITGFLTGVNTSTPANTTGAVDTTASVTVTVTFNVANTDKVTPRQFVVELIQ